MDLWGSLFVAVSLLSLSLAAPAYQTVGYASCLSTAAYGRYSGGRLSTRRAEMVRGS